MPKSRCAKMASYVAYLSTCRYHGFEKCVCVQIPGDRIIKYLSHWPSNHRILLQPKGRQIVIYSSWCSQDLPTTATRLKQRPGVKHHIVRRTRANWYRNLYSCGSGGSSPSQLICIAGLLVSTLCNLRGQEDDLLVGNGKYDPWSSRM